MNNDTLVVQLGKVQKTVPTATPSVIMTLTASTSKPLYKTMWAQISGMADNCSAGVIGRLGGQILHNTEREIKTTDMGGCSNSFYTSTSFNQLVLEVMPSNRVFAGPPEWLFWMILEDIKKKYENGIHTPKLKPKSVKEGQFDFEKNPYHKFWAGPSYQVKMWFMSDKVGIQVNGSCRVNAFVEFIRNNKLGYILESKPITASYSGEVTGTIFTPDVAKLKVRIPKELAAANKLLEARWAQVAKYKTSKTVIDKVGQLW